MKKIGLTSGFEPVPEGSHVFKVVGVDYKEAYGKLEITLQTVKGKKHTERYSLLKDNGEPNEGALNAFSFMAKTVLNNFDLEEIDPEEMIGHYVRCTVEHNKVESRNKPGQFLTFVQLSDKEPADGFDEEEPFVEVNDDSEIPFEEKPKKKSFNLDDILG